MPNESELQEQRRLKLNQIIVLGFDSWPNGYRSTHSVAELCALDVAERNAESLERESLAASTAGRIMALRRQGNAAFVELQGGGARLQIYIRRDDIGNSLFALVPLFDLGDHIGVRGYLMRTRTGRITLRAAAVDDHPAITFLAKALLPLPDKFHGLADTEVRYRQRYLDLIVN